jgi:hypothetical protein
MSTPDQLRQKAAQCRRLARQPRKGFPHGGGHNYLLDLAQRFEAEAAMLERRMAGDKPGSKDEAAPGEGAETSEAGGTMEPSRAS